MSLTKPKQDESQLNETIQEEDWQNFNQEFGDFDKLKSMVKLGKKLENFSVMVQGKQCGIPNLRKELHEIRNVKPESVKSLVDLTKTNEILVTERILTDAHRNTILSDILTTRKKLAEEIVAEGGKCSLMSTYAEVVNLKRAWDVVRDAKLIKHNARDEVAKIEETFDKVKTICLKAKHLMALYTASNDQQEKKTILEQLKVITKQIKEAYEKCFQMIQQIDLQIGEGIIKLQFLNFEQKEAAKLNKKRATSKLGPGIIFDPIKLLVPIAYVTVMGVNILATKSIEKIKEKLIEINEKLAELKQVANAIQDVIEEAQTFINANR